LVSIRRTSAMARSAQLRAVAASGATTRTSQREAIALNSSPYSSGARTTRQAGAGLRRLAAKVLRNFSTFGATTNMQYPCAGLWRKYSW
jgi:hypothetical protein